jgi:hypothetical protein
LGTRLGRDLHDADLLAHDPQSPPSGPRSPAGRRSAGG